MIRDDMLFCHSLNVIEPGKEVLLVPFDSASGAVQLNAKQKSNVKIPLQITIAEKLFEICREDKEPLAVTAYRRDEDGEERTDTVLRYRLGGFALVPCPEPDKDTLCEFVETPDVEIIDALALRLLIHYVAEAVETRQLSHA